MKVWLSLLICAMLSFVQLLDICAAEPELQHGDTKVCNTYVDGIIEDLKKEKEYFQDPYKIEEKSLVIHKKVLFINYTGEALIHEGFIYGLSSLHRDGDVIVDKKKKTHLKVYLGAGELKMNSEGQLKLMGHGPKVKVEAVISYISAKLDLVPDTEGANPTVNDFDIEETKGVKVKTSGLGPLNFFLNAYIHFMGTVFKGLVRTAMEKGIKTLLEDKFQEYVIPPECLQ